MITFACRQIDIRDLIVCSFALNKSSYKLLMAMLKSKKSNTVEELAGIMHVDRTSVQKAIKTLLERDLIDRRQINLKNGGYKFLYFVKDKGDIKQKMLSIIQKWNDSVQKEINMW